MELALSGCTAGALTHRAIFPPPHCYFEIIPLCSHTIPGRGADNGAQRRTVLLAKALQRALRALCVLVLNRGNPGFSSVQTDITAESTVLQEILAWSRPPYRMVKRGCGWGQLVPGLAQVCWWPCDMSLRPSSQMASFNRTSHQSFFSFFPKNEGP